MTTYTPEEMACQRCALKGDLRGEPSITQATKKGYIAQGRHHSEADCIRRLRDAINILREDCEWAARSDDQ